MPNKIINLSSDTVTLPTPEMLQAIATAELGDDILGEDPTVRRLEELGAEIFGKEASLLTISGTMANQVAVMTFTQRGQEVILGEESHIYNLEVAALATLSQVQTRPIPCPAGYFDPVMVRNAIQPPGVQKAATGLVCLENTYDLDKGLAITEENTREICAIAHHQNIPVYLDGARIFNAALSLGKNVAELTSPVDALQVCLTKGLSAPLGSLLAGKKEFIAEARRIRQRIGGGMRQAGIIAAAGIIALTKMVDRLAEDHEHAHALTKGLCDIDKRLLRHPVNTNIVSIDVGKLSIDTEAFFKQVTNSGIKIKSIGDGCYRMVCHRHISLENINYVLVTFNRVIKRLSKN